MTSTKRNALLLFVISLHSFFGPPVSLLLAQSLNPSSELDIFAPIILHQSTEESIDAGESKTFQVTATDDVGIPEVALFYRTAGAISIQQDPDEFI